MPQTRAAKNGGNNGAKAGQDKEAAFKAAEALFEKGAYEACAAAADDVLLGARLSILSKTALLRGRAILAPLLARLEDEKAKDPSETDFREAWVMFQLALRFVPENEEAQEEIGKLQAIVRELPVDEELEQPPNHSEPLDVVIIGAGCSGIGTALMLSGIFGVPRERVLLVERGEGVGETFRRWPKEMRFISPSFNSQGWTQSFDLNSCAYGTSPAFTLGAEHPTGEQYARYLEALVTTNELNVRLGTEVTAVTPFEDREGFAVSVTSEGKQEVLNTRFVVWAAGEFQYPRPAGEGEMFPGSDLCVHNSSVRSWKDLAGDDFVVVGGYESGMDAAYHLSRCGKRCTVVSSTAFWDVSTEDPSTELAPFTTQRIRTACHSETPPRLLAPLRVHTVEKAADGFVVKATWGPRAEPELKGEHREPVMPAEAAAQAAIANSTEGGEVTLRTPVAPVLCAGFSGSVKLGVASELFEWGDPGEGWDELEEAEDDEEDGAPEAVPEKMDVEGEPQKSGCAEGAPLLNEVDESIKTPGLFLVGPSVRHGDLSFCFVYKFRQRFGVVANAIAMGLDRETEGAVAAARDMNMYLDDFECCKGACGEAC